MSTGFYTAAWQVSGSQRSTNVLVLQLHTVQCASFHSPKHVLANVVADTSPLGE